MDSYIIRIGKDGRIFLGRFGVKPGQKFSVTTDQQGRIFLTPVPNSGEEQK